MATVNHSGETSPSLILFFILALGLSWAILIPEALATAGILPRHLPASLLVLAGFGPATAGLIAAWATGRAQSVRELLGRLVRLRVGWVWYLVALFGPGMVLLAGLALELALGGSPPPILRPPLQAALGFENMPVAVFLAALFLSTLVAVTGEELGWRGFALPRLQRLRSDLAAGVILGLVWGAWHLPLAWAPASQSGASQLPLWAFFIDITASSVLYVWIFNHSRGSVAIATLLHAANNTAAAFLMPPGAIDLRQFFLTVAVRLVLVVALVLIYRGPNFGRRPGPEMGLLR